MPVFADTQGIASVTFSCTQIGSAACARWQIVSATTNIVWSPFKAVAWSSASRNCVRGIANSKWPNRQAPWQKARLARPPKPPCTRAERRSERTISVEDFDARTGLWVNVVQRFVACVSFWVGNHCSRHGAPLAIGCCTKRAAAVPSRD